MAFVWVNFPLAVPLTLRTGLFPPRGAPEAQSVIKERCAIELCLGLFTVLAKNVNRGAATLPGVMGRTSSNKARQRQEILLLPHNSWYLQEDGFSQ